MRPSILNPKFSYTNAANTDIRKLFARVIKQQKRDQSVPMSKIVALRANKEK